MLSSTIVEQETGYENIPKIGTVTTLPITDIVAAADWLKYALALNETSLVVVSRMSPKRFNSIIPIDEISYHWMTNKDTPVGIEPSLERVNHLLQEYVRTGKGIIWLEGLEYLSSKHGFNPVLTFIRALVDEMSQTNWSLMLPFSSESLEPNEYAKLKREAPNWFPSSMQKDESVQVNDLETEKTYVEPQLEVETTILELVDEPEIAKVEVLSTGDIPLKKLTTIPEVAFTFRTLRERILAWRRMGLDVSSLEPALKYSDLSKSYSLYLGIEAQVNLAVDLDKKIDKIQDLGYSKETFKFRFMIRQLTGLERISDKIDELIELSRNQN